MNNKGFTLTETMVSIAIFLIIVMAVFMVFTSGKNTWFSGSAYTQAEQDLRKAKEWMAKEVLEARASTIEIGESNDEITFDIPVSVSESGSITWQNIRYYLNADTGQLRRQLVDDEDADEKVLANNVESVAFGQPDLTDSTIIRVTINTLRQDLKGRPMRSSVFFDLDCRN